MTSKEDFIEKIDALLLLDEDTRKTSDLYHFFSNESETNPNQTLDTLLSVMDPTTRVEVRREAVRVLQRLIVLLNSVTQERVKQLMAILRNESSEEIRKALTTTIISAQYEDNDYQLLYLVELLSWFETTDTKAQIIALEFMARQGFDASVGDFDFNKKHKTILLNILRKSMQDKNAELRRTALDATISLAVAVEKEDQPLLQDFVPLMQGVLQNDLNAGDHESAQKTISILVEAIESPFLFKKSPETIISAMYQVAKAKPLKQALRVQAIEFLASFGESMKQARKKIPNFNETIIQLCFDLITEVLTEDNFDLDEEIDEPNYEITLYDAGLETMDRLAFAVGGKVMAPLVLKTVDIYMKKPDWKSKVAALMALSQTAESCREFFLPLLPKIVTSVLQEIKSDTPRLRYAAIHSIAQMCTDLAPEIQEEHGATILEELLESLDDSNEHVKKHAAEAIVNIMDGCPKDIVAPFLGELVSKLISQVKSDQISVKKPALTALAAIADSSADLFKEYYDSIIPILRMDVEKAHEKDVRDKLGECISIFMNVVGKEKASADVDWFMQYLFAETVFNDFTAQAHMRIARCMGKDFIKYTDQVVRVAVLSIGKYVQALTNDLSLMATTGTTGERQIDEHAIGVNLIGELVGALKEDIVPYVPLFMPALIAALNTYDVELTVATSNIITEPLKYLRESTSNQESYLEWYLIIYNKLTSNLAALYEIDPIEANASALARMIDLWDEKVANHVPLTHIYQQVINCYNGLVATVQPQEDEDEEEEEEEVDEKEQDAQRYAFIAIGEIIAALLRKNIILDYTLLSFVGNIDSQPAVVRYSALYNACVFVEFGGEAMQQHYYVLLPQAHHLFADLQEDTDAQQLFAYTLGILGKVGGSAADYYITNYSQMLINMLENDVEPAAYNNAVSAVFKILLYRDLLVVENVLDYLPLTDEGDKDEKRLAYDNMITLVEQGNKLLLGENNENKERIKEVLADYYKEADETVRERIRKLN